MQSIQGYQPISPNYMIGGNSFPSVQSGGCGRPAPFPQSNYMSQQNSQLTSIVQQLVSTVQTMMSFMTEMFSGMMKGMFSGGSNNFGLPSIFGKSDPKEQSSGFGSSLLEIGKSLLFGSKGSDLWDFGKSIFKGIKSLF